MHPAPPMSQFQNTIDCNTQAKRRFKACRMCRKHKLKCERKDESTCHRCHEHAIQCVYDVVGARKRFTNNRDKDGSINTLTREQEAENAGINSSPATQSIVRAQDTTAALDLDSLPDIAAASNPFAFPHAVPGQGLEDSPLNVDADFHRRTPAGQTSDLTSDDLQAPVSALHNMSQYDGHLNERLTKTSTDSGFVRAPYQPLTGSLFRNKKRRDDLLSTGILNQRQARRLFNLFMAGVSSFLPIFDPVLDSFETLRANEPLCFAVVLAVAACIDGLPTRDRCLKEVKELVAENLFTYPASIGSIQAMVILVAYGECTWFALGHALQMALDLGLDKIISHEQLCDDQIPTSRSVYHKQVIRSARIWFALCFTEREIALGSGKSSRIPMVRAEDLAHFTLQSDANPAHMRITALVEAVQIRDEFLAAAAATEIPEDAGLHQLRSMEARLDEWFQRWDAIHKDHGYDIASFQRTSLAGQRRYAMMFLGCAIIGRSIGKRPLSVAIMSRGDHLSDIIDLVLSIAVEQMCVVSLSESYKWHLQWATNYTILSLTFAGVFALEVSRYQANSNHEKVFTTVSGIAQILADYHDPFFHQLLLIRLSRHPGLSSSMNLDQFNLVPNSQSVGRCSQRPPSAHHSPASAAGINSHIQLPVDVARGSMVTGTGSDDMYQQITLNQLLETPDWMINPSSMLGFDLENWQNDGTFAADR